jgi:hypothetical protein
MGYGCAVYEMHTVSWTSVFERQAKAVGLTFEDIFDIAATIAINPLAGDLIVGSGGARSCGTRAGIEAKAAAIGRSTTSQAKISRFSCWH